MQIELLVVADCPHEAAAPDPDKTALADTGVKATVTRTLITAHPPGWRLTPMRR